MRAVLLLLLSSLAFPTSCTGENPWYEPGGGVDLAETAVPAEMVRVPGGTFPMGSADGQPDEQPVRAVAVSDFLLDRTLVTVGAYRRCVATGICSAPANGVPCNWTEAAGSRESHPINCVSWFQAADYCALNRKRMPTEEEFEYAARGPSGSVYAWGNAAPIVPGRGQPQLCWNQPLSTCPVGSFAPTLLGKPDRDGAFDLGGNLWEWMAGRYCTYDATPRCTENLSLRGGAWNRTDPADMRAARRNATVSNAQASDVGFRCARSL